MCFLRAPSPERCWVLDTSRTGSVTKKCKPFHVTVVIDGAGLTIGSNSADIPPAVPKLHRWVDKATGTDVIVAYVNKTSIKQLNIPVSVPHHTPHRNHAGH